MKIPKYVIKQLKLFSPNTDVRSHEIGFSGNDSYCEVLMVLPDDKLIIKKYGDDWSGRRCQFCGQPLNIRRRRYSNPSSFYWEDMDRRTIAYIKDMISAGLIKVLLDQVLLHISPGTYYMGRLTQDKSILHLNQGHFCTYKCATEYANLENV